MRLIRLERQAVCHIEPRACRCGCYEWLPVALLMLASLDQLKFYYGAQASDTASLSRASELNPFDAALQLRLARANDRAGNQAGKRAALEAAVRVNPTFLPAQVSLARVLIESGKYEEAYAHYQQMFTHLSPDVDSLVNVGVLAAQLDRDNEAIAAWQKALELSASQANAHLYLADALTRQKRFKEAIPHYEHYLALIASQGSDQKASTQLPQPELVLRVVLQLSKTCRNAGDDAAAQQFFAQGASLASQLGDRQGLALALIESAEIKASQGKRLEALASFQQVLNVENSGSLNAQASYWFSFARFLKQNQTAPRLVLTCLLKAEALLQTDSTKDDGAALAAAVKAELQATETALGADQSKAVRRDLDSALREVLSMKS